MTKLGTVALMALALAACNAMFGVDGLSYEPTATQSGGGATSSAASGRGAATGTSSGGAATSATGGGGGSTSATSSGGGGGAPPTLSNDGLVVRYYVDEADSGMAAGALEDAAPNPLDLPIVSDPELVYVELSDNRGLRWTTGSVGRASLQVDGTKIAQQLNTATSATIEVVAAMGATQNWVARMVEIAPPGAVGSNLALLLEDGTSQLTLEVNNANGGAERAAFWDYNLVDDVRHVIHAVVDTSEANSLARARLYVDGAAITDMNVTGTLVPLGQNEPLTVGANDYLTVGNTPDGNRAFVGRIFYVAIYDVALDDQDIANHTVVLSNSDDEP